MPSRRIPILAIAVILAGACAAPTDATTPDTIAKTVQFGALRLDLSDSPSRIGILFTRPIAEASTGAVTVTSTRYGSLCRYAVTGSSVVDNRSIVVHVRFAETTALCTADIRALTYRATVGGLAAGTYSMRVLHDESSASEEVLSQSIVVR